MKLRWKKKPSPKGRIIFMSCADKGSILHDGVDTFATTAVHSKSAGSGTQWYWYCGANEALGIEPRNTADSQCYASEDDAKRDALAYIKACLSDAGKAQ